MTRATTTLRRPFMLLAILGPGLIAANAGNDAAASPPMRRPGRNTPTGCSS